MFSSTFRNPKYAIRISYCVLLFFLAACGPAATPTPFIAPFTQKITPTKETSASFWTSTPAATLSNVGTGATPDIVSQATASVEPQISPTLEPTTAAQPAEPPSPTPKTCSDALRYLEDLTYPDGSLVSPGQALEKRWRVENNGSCDWDGRYRLRIVDGYPALGAAVEQALSPARAGAQSTISINFTAPLEAGTYRTAWQAYNPEGFAFGEVVYMEVIVSQ